MTRLEFYMSFQFVFELLLSELLFVYRLPRRSYFPLRLIGALAALFLYSWGLSFLSSLSTHALYISFIFLMIFLATIFVNKFLFKTTWLTVVFCCFAGYTTQHVAYEIYTLSVNLMGGNADAPMGFYGSEPLAGSSVNLFFLAVYFIVYIFTYFVCFYTFGNRLKSTDRIHLKKTFFFLFAVLLLIIDIVLNAIIVYYVAPDGKMLYLIIVGVYNILCCIVSLNLQFSVALAEQTQSTLEQVQRLWQQAKEQYEASKLNIELINLRSHDLKHLVGLIGRGESVGSATLQDIEKRISDFDAEAKTGNVALDVILTEKGLLCNRHGIKLTVQARGECLEFMTEEDIYVFFGNIIDNAIEAVLKAEPEKRIIDLRIQSVNHMVVVQESNYFTEGITFVNGYPQTTKADKRLHGYGLKSIELISEQYGGSMTIKTEGEIFKLNVVFCDAF